MCYGCWIEAGAPVWGGPRAQELADAAREIFESGPLHAVVSDWNLDDENLQSALADEELLEAERAWVTEMAELPWGQRHAVMAMADGFVAFDVVGHRRDVVLAFEDDPAPQ